MSKIKICGMQSFHDIRLMNRLQPDYVGFIFDPARKRYVDPDFAYSMKAELDPAIKACGVFVDAEPQLAADLASRGIIDMIQLHGEEDEDYIKTLRELTDKPIIKAFVVRGDEDIRAAIRSSADYVLLDSGRGSGRSFDWHYIREFPRPFFLAGGLTPDNVKNAINMLHPYAVDVSSGVEYDPPARDRTEGTKDREKTEQLMKEAR